MPAKTEVITYQSDQIQIQKGFTSQLLVLSDQVQCAFLNDLKPGFPNTFSYPVWVLCLDKHLQENSVKISGKVILHETSNYRRQPGFELDINEFISGGKVEQNREAFKYSLDFKLDLNIEIEEASKVSYEELFEKSEKDDTALEIEGKVVYVNKKFLSENSDYFQCLFSNDFGDSKKDVIPIELSTYDEFGMLFSKFWPGKEQEIRDHEVEKLLELAQRYQFNLATQLIGQHLANCSKFSIAKVLGITEKYQMTSVKEEILNDLSHLDVMATKLFPSYADLSEATKQRLEEILQQNIRN